MSSIVECSKHDKSHKETCWKVAPKNKKFQQRWPLHGTFHYRPWQCNSQIGRRVIFFELTDFLPPFWLSAVGRIGDFLFEAPRAPWPHQFENRSVGSDIRMFARMLGTRQITHVLNAWKKTGLVPRHVFVLIRMPIERGQCDPDIFHWAKTAGV